MLVKVPGTGEEGAYSRTVLGRLCGGSNVRHLGRPCRMCLLIKCTTVLLKSQSREGIPLLEMPSSKITLAYVRLT